MKDLSENEWLSAYVDGELTDEERAELEQLIQDNPAARQLVDEFRALRERLRALPSFQVGEDLSRRVLRRAERQILSEPATPARPPIWRRLVCTRNLVWVGLVTAVALVLAVVDQVRVQKPGNQVAAVKRPQPEALRPPSNPPSIGPMREARSEPGRKPDIEAHLAPPPAESRIAKTTPPAGIDSPRAPAVPMRESVTRKRPEGGKPGEQQAENSASSTPKAPADSRLQRGRRTRATQGTPMVSCRVTAAVLRDGTLQQIFARHDVTLRSKDIRVDAAFFEAEFTPTQYQGVLNDLRARPEAFLEVSPPSSLSEASPHVPSTGGLSYRVQRSHRGSQSGAGSSGSRVTAQNEAKYLVRFELRVESGK